MNMIYWVLTRRCNFECIYCHRHQKDDENISINDFQKIKDFVNTIMNKTEIFLTGGEPTISPYFFDIIENINYNKFSINSNFSFNEDISNRLIDFFKINNDRKNLFKATYHADQANLEIFLNNISNFYKYDMIHKINMVFESYDISYIEKYYKPIYDLIKKEFPKIFLRIMPVDNDDLSNEILNMFKGDIWRRSRGNIIDTNCYINNMCIDSNGDVYNCINYISYLNKYKPLFNIINNKNALRLHNFHKTLNKKCVHNFCCTNKMIQYV
jgi:MoaA/NifB/PqqE/SkfB family radical SAM enzyme